MHQVRIARPVRSIEEATRLYTDGLGLAKLGSFQDHEGFDGVMLGEPGASCHFEFTFCRHHAVEPRPTEEDLIVFYLPEQEWSGRCQKMLEAGFKKVPSFNPYWDANGGTFEDADGYRVVIART